MKVFQLKDTIRILKFWPNSVFSFKWPQNLTDMFLLISLSIIVKHLIQSYESKNFFDESYWRHLCPIQKGLSKTLGNKFLEIEGFELDFDHWTGLTIQISICFCSFFLQRLLDGQEMSIRLQSSGISFSLLGYKKFRFFARLLLIKLCIWYCLPFLIFESRDLEIESGKIFLYTLKS